MNIQEIIDTLKSIINQQDCAFEPLTDYEIKALNETIILLNNK